MILKTRPHHAFSIIELLIVLATVVIITTIAIPQFFNAKKQALVHDVEKLFMVCSYLQQKAITSHKTLTLVVHPTMQSYSYSGLHNKETQVSLSSGATFDFIAGAKGPPGDPTKPIIAPITFEGKKNYIPHITFFNNGKISPGTAYLVDSTKKHMGALTCGLSSVSYIRKYLYNDSLWIMI